MKDEKKKLKNANMPWRWMSLETLERRVYTQASDIWSFGVVMWEIFSFGMMPYQTLENDQILKFLQEVNFELYLIMRTENYSRNFRFYRPLIFLSDSRIGRISPPEKFQASLQLFSSIFELLNFSKKRSRASNWF